MWILKLKIKHDCTIGNRCGQFSCESFSTPLTQWTENNYEYVLGQHILMGNPNEINKFVKDLAKDPRTSRLERERNTLYLLERHKKLRIPARLYNKKIFFVKPVFVDKQGYEIWEVASFEKKILQKYIKELKKEKSIKFKIEKIIKSKIKDVFFPKVMPLLTEKQKRAFELAIENEYYAFPRKTDLGKLAKLMKVSLSTFQEHLRKAEEKTIPSLK